MKKIMLYLAFLIAVPGIVYAGANYMLNAKHVYVVNAHETDRISNPQFYNYRLVWNDDIGKFELRDGQWHLPPSADEVIPLQQMPESTNDVVELAI